MIYYWKEKIHYLAAPQIVDGKVVNAVVLARQLRFLLAQLYEEPPKIRLCNVEGHHVFALSREIQLPQEGEIPWCILNEETLEWEYGEVPIQGLFRFGKPTPIRLTEEETEKVFQNVKWIFENYNRIFQREGIQ